MKLNKDYKIAYDYIAKIKNNELREKLLKRTLEDNKNK
jgi:hypothetical protein